MKYVFLSSTVCRYVFQFFLSVFWYGLYLLSHKPESKTKMSFDYICNNAYIYFKQFYVKGITIKYIFTKEIHVEITLMPRP